MGQPQKFLNDKVQAEYLVKNFVFAQDQTVTRYGHKATDMVAGFHDNSKWSLGRGSKDRLVLACKPTNIAITKQEEEGTVRVGMEDFHKLKVELTVAGTFRVIQDSH